MIIHPDLDRRLLTTAYGRMLNESFNLLGVQIPDPHRPERVWTISALYAPIRGRAVGGIRAHVTDQKGFISFINQRDLEVLLGVGVPGTYCKWLGKDYVDPSDRDDWFGFSADQEDLTDDLFAREAEIRFAQHQQTGEFYVRPNVEMSRLIHLSVGVDYDEQLIGRGDWDGHDYDQRMETLYLRWTRAGRTPLSWRQL